MKHCWIFNSGYLLQAPSKGPVFHSNIKVHVVEKDITKTQKKVASIRAKATMIGGENDYISSIN